MAFNLLCFCMIEILTPKKFNNMNNSSPKSHFVSFKNVTSLKNHEISKQVLFGRNKNPWFLRAAEKNWKPNERSRAKCQLFVKLKSWTESSWLASCCNPTKSRYLWEIWSSIPNLYGSYECSNIYSCCLRLHEGCNDRCVLRVLQFMDVRYVSYFWAESIVWTPFIISILNFN